MEDAVEAIKGSVEQIPFSWHTGLVVVGEIMM